MKDNLHKLIRILEHKKALAEHAFNKQKREELSGKDVRVTSMSHKLRILKYADEIHELKLKR